MTTRPIHRLVLINPVEEQVIEESGENEALGPESRNQDEEVDDGVQKEEGVEPLGTGGSNEGPVGDTQHKKAGPPKGARKCLPPADVTVPEEEEEIVDVGVIPKRGRGRPKRSKEVNSMDPHKGSVTDGREGVCVDPGKRDAILGKGGPAPPGKGEGQQLVPDSGGGET